MGSRATRRPLFRGMLWPMKIAAAFAALLVLTGGSRSAAPAAGGNWAQWRGPDGLGISAGTTYPQEWSPDKNVAWKTPIAGRGHSSPIVWGDRIFLTTSIEGGKAPDGHTAPVHPGFDLKPGYLHPDSVGVDRLYTLKVMAIEATSGKPLWDRTVYEGVMYDNRHRKNTYASSTMATDGTAVYAFFESAGLYAFDVNGTPLWKKSLGGIAKAGMGPGTSPVIFEDLLILQCDQEMGEGSFIVALDRKDGREMWRQARTTRRSWATPLIVRTPARVEMIAAGAERVVSYDPRTGRELWRANGTESHPIPSAVAGNGLVFLSAGSSAKRAMAIRLGGDGDLTDSPAVVWRYRKGAAYVPSPILHGPYLYLMSDSGIITCLEAATGQVMYEGGRPPVPATFTASLVSYGGVLLATSEEGDTFVIKTGPTHEVLRTNSIGEPVYASLALAGDSVYIRGAQHLFAIRAGR
jgi:outer membrane protein assembly factor BamB